MKLLTTARKENPEADPKIHSPRMKVFTVGLDEKEKAAKAQQKENEMEKGSALPVEENAAPAPAIIVKKTALCKGWFSFLCALFLVLIFALTLSEIAYNRHRDEQFLRLKWAELKQRMMGMEMLRQNQIDQHNKMLETENHIKVDAPPPVVDERLAFSKRIGQEEESAHSGENPTIPPQAIVDDDVERSNSEEQTQGDLRLDFLKAILGRIREQAMAHGLPDTMRVSVIAVKPKFEEDATMEPSMADGFGEWAAPRQNFPAPGEQDPEYYDYDQQPWGRQFDRETFRGRFPFPSNNNWNKGVQNDNEWNPTMEMNDGVMEQQNGPNMKITHHFDKDNGAMPAKIVTELYGADAEQVLKNLLGQKENAQTQNAIQQQTTTFDAPQPAVPQQNNWRPDTFPAWNPQQQQWQGPAQNGFPHPEHGMIPQQFSQQQPQQQQIPQQFAAQFGQAFGQNFGQNWERNMQQQWNGNNQWQNSLPQSFSVPLQQQQIQQQPQLPRFPFENQQQQNQPWYQSQNGWPVQDNNNNMNTEQKIVSDSASVVPEEETRFTNLNEENEGVDNFERKEQFNVPMDMISDERSEEVPKADLKVNAWEETQPAASEAETAPVKAPPSPSEFLPTRDEIEQPPKEDDVSSPEVSSMQNDDVASDEFTIDKHSPLFQIDDPSSFRN